MKKLALMMFAILILGCDTEQPAVKEPEPEPAVMEDPLSQPELIAEGTVKHGEVNVDPKLLNLSGFRFVLKEPVYDHWVSVYDKKRGKHLWNWNSPQAHWCTETKVVLIEHMGSGDLLEHNTDYEITIYTPNSDCDVVETVIQFRTEPQRSTVEEPEPVMQERPPVVPSGERFRLDRSPPTLEWGDVQDGDAGIDPRPLNANGIRFRWDRNIIKYRINLSDHKGASLHWLPHDLVEGENIGKETQIMPAAEAPLLKFDTVYIIDIFVQDRCCWTQDSRITFRTQPKP